MLQNLKKPQTTQYLKIDILSTFSVVRNEEPLPSILDIYNSIVHVVLEKKFFKHFSYLLQCLTLNLYWCPSSHG